MSKEVSVLHEWSQEEGPDSLESKIFDSFEDGGSAETKR
jgi:hypothetical protein